MASGHPNRDLGPWRTGAAAGIECNDCEHKIDNLTDAQALREARKHVFAHRHHHVTRSATRFQDVNYVYEPSR